MTASDSAPDAQPWKSLYDGRSLRGWRVPAQAGSWKASDWTLRGQAGPASEEAVLWSNGTLQRDELVFDWRWEGKTVDRMPPMVFRSARGAGLIRIPALAGLRAEGWNRLRVRRSGFEMKVSANDGDEVLIEAPRGGLEFGFMPAAGSSRSRNFGSSASARAISRRRRSP